MYIQGSYPAAAATVGGWGLGVRGGGGCHSRYMQGAGGKADVKRCHSRLMGAGGERDFQGDLFTVKTEPQQLI